MIVRIKLYEAEIIADIPKSTKLSKNFKLYELANNAGSVKLPQYEINEGNFKFVQMLQRLRDSVNQPIKVNSGYRQAAYNSKIGGNAKSAHLHGWAADIKKIYGMSDERIAATWRAICSIFGTIGAINLYDNYYHLEINSNICYGASKFEIRDRRTNNERTD